MLTAQHTLTGKPDLSAATRRTAAIGGATHVPGFRSRVKGTRGYVRAVISGGDNKTQETATAAVEKVSPKGYNGSLFSSSPNSGWIDVRAVITIRKKMKEKINEKIEDLLEGFVNGIGQGILLQLISEEIDPGQF